MNPLSLFRGGLVGACTQPEAAAQQESLEDVLLDLARWGQPRVGQYSRDGTWHCHIEVNVSPVGVKFEAKSDFQQKTPLAAALMCRKHLLDAIKTIGAGV